MKYVTKMFFYFNILSRKTPIGNVVIHYFHEDKSKDVNEHLGSYWKCLGGMEQKRWYAQEIHN